MSYLANLFFLLCITFVILHRFNSASKILANRHMKKYFNANENISINSKIESNGISTYVDYYNSENIGYVANSSGNVGKKCHFDEDCILQGNCTKHGKCEETHKSCRCDDACVNYGDCCLRAKAYNQTKVLESVGNFKCFQADSHNQGYYMKDKCLSGWTDKKIEQLCQKKFSYLESYSFVQTPVTNSVTNVTYVNIYCAICNNDSLADIETWHADVRCGFPSSIDRMYYNNISESEFLSNVQLVNGLLRLLLSNNSTEQVFMNCKFYPVIPKNIQDKVRDCIGHISTCSSDWTIPQSERLCHTYTNIIYSIGKYYRNYHCAVCNFVDVTRIPCTLRSMLPLLRNPRFSLYVLFHFGGSEINCTVGESYDFLSKKCYSAFCLKENYEFRFGKCHKRSENGTRLNVLEHSAIKGNNTLFCNKVFINDSDYIQEQNFRIYVISKQKTYTKDEYDYYPNGILICHYFKYAVLERITYVGLGISSISLVLHLLTFFMVPDLRNLPGKNMASLSVSLLCLYTCFIFANALEYDNKRCFYLSSIMYYFFIASFSWMNVMSFDIWIALHASVAKLQVASNQPWKKFMYYSIYAWLLPGCSLCTVLTIDLMKPSFIPVNYLPHLGKKFCWLGKKNAIFVYFAAPLAIIMTTNIIFFLLAAWTVKVAASSRETISSAKKNKGQLKIYVKLASLMGLTWSSAVIAGYFQLEFMKYLCVVLNSLQGLFILYTYTWSKKVINALTDTRFFKISLLRWRSARTESSFVEDDNFAQLDPKGLLHCRIVYKVNKNANNQSIMNSAPCQLLQLRPLGCS